MISRQRASTLLPVIAFLVLALLAIYFILKNEHRIFLSLNAFEIRYELTHPTFSDLLVKYDIRVSSKWADVWRRIWAGHDASRLPLWWRYGINGAISVFGLGLAGVLAARKLWKHSIGVVFAIIVLLLVPALFDAGVRMISPNTELAAQTGGLDDGGGWDVRFGDVSFPRLQAAPAAAVLVASLFVQVVLSGLLWFRLIHKRSPVKVAYRTAFGSLSFKPLPRGTLNQWSMRVFYGGENSMPAENLGPQLLEYIDNVLYLISEKSLQDVELWRCTSEDSSRLLLLVDRRVGFGRRVWCLLDFTRPGDGTDVNIKFHRLYPRHLDVFDWTLLRYIGFPFLVAIACSHLIEAMDGKGTKEIESKPGQWSFILLVCALLASIFAAVIGGFIAHSIHVAIVVGLWAVLSAILLSFVIYAFEAREPLTDMERHSAELMIIVQECVQTGTHTMGGHRH